MNRAGTLQRIVRMRRMFSVPTLGNPHATLLCRHLSTTADRLRHDHRREFPTSKNAPGGGEEQDVSLVHDKEQKESLFTFARLRQVSDFASFLCVLDCTILPAVTVVLPIIGILELEASQLEFFHYLGHNVALYFVLPIGGTTTVINFLSHKKVSLASMATLGLCTIGLANSHVPCDLALWAGGHEIQLDNLLQKIQHGPMHSAINTFGCACLLTSNYLSRQLVECTHDHGGNSCLHTHQDRSTSTCSSGDEKKSSCSQGPCESTHSQHFHSHRRDE